MAQCYDKASVALLRRIPGSFAGILGTSIKTGSWLKDIIIMTLLLLLCLLFPTDYQPVEKGHCCNLNQKAA